MRQCCLMKRKKSAFKMYQKIHPDNDGDVMLRLRQDYSEERRVGKKKVAGKIFLRRFSEPRLYLLFFGGRRMVTLQVIILCHVSDRAKSRWCTDKKIVPYFYFSASKYKSAVYVILDSFAKLKRRIQRKDAIVQLIVETCATKYYCPLACRSILYSIYLLFSEVLQKGNGEDN